MKILCAFLLAHPWTFYFRYWAGGPHCKWHCKPNYQRQHSALHWPLLSCWLGEMHWTASWRWREYWCMLLGWSWAGTVPALVTGDGSGQRPKKLYYIQTTTWHCSTTHSCLLQSWLSFTQLQDKNLPNSAIVIIPLFGCAINISQQPNNYHRKNF